MGARTVGAGRGAVFAGGQVYMEGATIPDDVAVGEHVFADVDAVEGNVTVTPVRPVTVDASDAEPPAPDADPTPDPTPDPSAGTIDEVRARIAAGEVTAVEVLEAEQAKGDEARSTLVDELKATVNAGT